MEPLQVKTKDFDFSVDGEKITFQGEVETDVTKAKMTSAMDNLLYQPFNGEDSWNYVFANGAYKPGDRELYDKYGYMNGITIVNSGTVNGECRKNSGHYHMLNEGHVLPYPEVYEVITGTAMFVLQESHNFMEDDFDVESFRFVILHTGDKILIPPYCGHCAINIGDDEMAFYNLACECPLAYEPITNKHGYGYYMLKEAGVLAAVPNPNYKNLPTPRIVEAIEVPELGITRDKTVYQAFKENPDIFRYLDHPEDYENIWKEYLK